jgi:hypothetical protein
VRSVEIGSVCAVLAGEAEQANQNRGSVRSDWICACDVGVAMTWDGENPWTYPEPERPDECPNCGQTCMPCDCVADDKEDDNG